MDAQSKERPELNRRAERAKKAKRAWRRPELKFMGKLGTFVQGWGKSGYRFDSDPKGTRKRGVG